MRIAFFGSSLVSAYWNGAATYYRGILRALHDRGHQITFYEPDAFDRQLHRDLPTSPHYAVSVVYPADAFSARAAVAAARGADIVVKASGVGVFDELLEEATMELKGTDTRVIFWDVDAPATLDRANRKPADPFRALIPEYDLILTYGGGKPVVDAYEKLGARRCVPIYNALDANTHYPVNPDSRFEGLLGFCGNRIPDREKRVREFFFHPAEMLPRGRFLLGGNGWDINAPQLPNVSRLGHVYTEEHNAFNSTPVAILNISRQSMAEYGFSPATQVFEAAGAGACIITDRWEGIEQFLAPDTECLVADNGEDVARHLLDLNLKRAKAIGAAARKRVLEEHTYRHRAADVEEALAETNALKGAA